MTTNKSIFFNYHTLALALTTAFLSTVLFWMLFSFFRVVLHTDVEKAQIEVEQTKAEAPMVAPVVQDERLWALYGECVDEWRACDFQRKPREHYDEPGPCQEKVYECGRLIAVMQGERY